MAEVGQSTLRLTCMVEMSRIDETDFHPSLFKERRKVHWETSTNEMYAGTTSLEATCQGKATHEVTCANIDGRIGTNGNLHDVRSRQNVSA